MEKYIPVMSLPWIEIYREEAVGLKNSNYSLKITTFVNMWNFDNFLKIDIL